MDPQKRFYDTPRYSRWLELYLDKNNAQGLNTYRNQTLAACHAYNYNTDDRKAYLVAAQVGHKNINKYKQTISNYYDRQGITMGFILDMYIKIMIAKKDINMLYSLAQDMDIDLPEYICVTNPKCPHYRKTYFYSNKMKNSQALSEDQVIWLGNKS